MDLPPARPETDEGRQALDRGDAALSAGEWEQARDAFARALVTDASPEAFDGLGRALWWLRRPSDAIGYRQRAYRGFRRRGDDTAAAHCALWLAREYTEALGKTALGSGWLARADGLADPKDARSCGWVDLVRAELALDVPTALEDATRARERGRAARDADLETRALAQLGLVRVRRGDVQAGMACFDDAMAAATGEPRTELETLAEACGKLVAACELTGDRQRMQQWAGVVGDVVEGAGHRPLLALRGSCCGDALVADGQWEQAEAELVRTIEALEASGETVRCVRPAARLAELRLHQGRLEEAQSLIAGREHLPEVVRPLAALHRARGDAAAAARVLRRRLSIVGDAALLAAPLLAALVETELERGDLAAAREAAGLLAQAAERGGGLALIAEAHLAAGRVATAAGDPSAGEDIEAAAGIFSALGMAYRRARAHLELAQARARAGDAPAARAQASLALATFERLRAPHDADRAAALLRGA